MTEGYCLCYMAEICISMSYKFLPPTGGQIPLYLLAIFLPKGGWPYAPLRSVRYYAAGFASAANRSLRYTSGLSNHQGSKGSWAKDNRLGKTKAEILEAVDGLAETAVRRPAAASRTEPSAAAAKHTVAALLIIAPSGRTISWHTII